MSLSLLSALTLLPAAIFCAPWTAENDAWNVNRNRFTRNPTEYFGQAPANFSHHPSPADWRQESVYQVITDRFADGDPQNNEGQSFGFGGYDLRFVNTRHGGDFRGLANRLDYIKSLGYSAVWVSPVFQNMENSYHGYAQIDFTLLDDRFGTLADFRDFVQQAHSKGLYVIVDIVVNHMADLYHFEGYKGAPMTPFHMHKGEFRMFPHNERRQYADFVVDNNFDSRGRYGPVYDDRGQRVDDNSPYSGSFWSSDFHHTGDLRDAGYGDPWNNHLGKIYGLMDDIRTTHPRIIQKIIAMTKALLTSADIDGIRVDTPMQVPLSFFQGWVPAIREHASKLGKTNFGVFGEFYCTRERGATMTGRGISKKMDRFGRVLERNFIGNDDQVTMDGGIHYPLYFWFQEAVRDQKHNVAGLMHLYDQDRQDYDFYNPAANWTWQYRNLHFFNNHDQWRLAASTSHGYEKTKLASAIIALWPGIPLYYYGDEQQFDFPGTALDGWAREDFMTSLAWSKGDKGCPPVPAKEPVIPTPSDGYNRVAYDSFSQTNPHFLYVQRLMAIRRTYSVFSACDSVYERWHQPQFMNGIFAYTRACGEDPTQWALVMFNTWSDTLTVPAKAMYSGWQSGSEIWNLLGERELVNDKWIPKERYQLETSGFIRNTIAIGGFEVKAFVRDDGFIGWGSPSIVSVTPQHDTLFDSTTLKDGIKVEIIFSDPMNIDSVKKAIHVDDESVADIASKDPFSFTFTLSDLSEGLHFISISESAKSAMGSGSLYGSFKSRFRIGNPANNVIMNPCLNFNQVDSMISSVVFDEVADDANDKISAMKWKCAVQRGVWGLPDRQMVTSSEIRVTLRHLAHGAKKVRVKIGKMERGQGGLSPYPMSVAARTSVDKSKPPVAFQPPKLLIQNQEQPKEIIRETASTSIQWISEWSSWIEYKDELEHILSAQAFVADRFCDGRINQWVGNVPRDWLPQDRIIDLTVQYWVDDSAAYYLTTKIQV